MYRVLNYYVVHLELIITITVGQLYVCALSHARLFVTPWTVAHQAPLTMEFSRQEYWNVLPAPSLWDLPNPGIEPTSPALERRILYHRTTWEAWVYYNLIIKTIIK